MKHETKQQGLVYYRGRVKFSYEFGYTINTAAVQVQPRGKVFVFWPRAV